MNSSSALIFNSSLSYQEPLLTLGTKTISMLDVSGVRYGIAAIQLDMYTIGRRWTIEFQTSFETISVHLRSYFGINKNVQHKKFCALLEATWQSSVVRMVNEMVERVDDGETVTVGGCEIDSNGIRCYNFLITWEDLSYQKNYNRLTLNSKSNDKVWTNLYYLETYNAQVLMYFLDHKFAEATETV